MCNYILIHELWPMAWFSKLGKEVQTSLVGKKKKSEDICVLGECSPKGEHLNNQVDRLTHFVDTSQPLPRH